MLKVQYRPRYNIDNLTLLTCINCRKKILVISNFTNKKILLDNSFRKEYSSIEKFQKKVKNLYTTETTFSANRYFHPHKLMINRYFHPHKLMINRY